MSRIDSRPSPFPSDQSLDHARAETVALLDREACGFHVFARAARQLVAVP
jgi:hypothetical protein